MLIIKQRTVYISIKYMQMTFTTFSILDCLNLDNPEFNISFDSLPV